jgi:hypothetical protein
MVLPEDDRRVAVLTNPKKKQTPEYYDRLEGSLTKEHARQVYWYLMHRDVSGYDHVYPPMTPAKMTMTEHNMAPSDAIRAHILDMCAGDLLTKKMLKSRVMAAASSLDYEKILKSPGGTVRSLWGRMKKLRETKNGARYYVKGEQVEVRSIRDQAHWASLDENRNRAAVELELQKNETNNLSNLKLVT